MVAAIAIKYTMMTLTYTATAMASIPTKTVIVFIATILWQCVVHTLADILTYHLISIATVSHRNFTSENFSSRVVSDEN